MRYVEIKFNALLDPEWSFWLNDLKVMHLETKTTMVSGTIEDLSELYGLLEKIRNLGLEPVYLKYELTARD